MQLGAAFRSGKPARAWELVQQLLTFSRKAVIEAGQARFKVNYGTTTCETCDGLKAGEGVLATCFQVRQCYYRNVKAGSESPKQRSIINELTRGRGGT